MANQKSFFLTGANAKVVLNNVTVAFATDISYRVTVRHASPRVLGRFEVEAHQPLAYDVEGSLTIIRYSRGLQSYMKGNAPKSVDAKGSGVGSYSAASFGGAIGGAIGLPTPDGQFDGAADEGFNPVRMFQSKQFDIEIRQKVPGADFSGAPILSGGLFGSKLTDETSVVLLRDCRFTAMDFNLTKRGAALMTLSFKARYADDDTFIATKSGVGQELS